MGNKNLLPNHLNHFTVVFFFLLVFFFSFHFHSGGKKIHKKLIIQLFFYLYFLFLRKIKEDPLQSLQLWSSFTGQPQKDLDMSQPDIINHNRPISSSSNRHPTINDDDNVVDQRISIMTSPTSVKRYATYDLNWNNLNYDLDQNNQDNDIITNSAQAARWSLPNSPNSNTVTTQEQSPPPPPQQQKQRHSKIRKSISPIIINTKKSDLRDKNDDEPQSPFGGITVTTVKVVEILHSPTEKDDDFNGIKSQQRKSRPELLNLSSEELPVGIITSESSKDRKHNKQRINLSLPPSNSVSSLSLKNPKLLNQKKRSSIINSQKIKGNKNLKKSEMIIPKEMSFIDPRLLAINNSLVRAPTIITTTTTATTTNRNRKTIRRGGSFYRKKLPPKNLEFGSTSNPIYSNDPTDMEADLPPIKHKTFPWLPGPPKPPQLLHASLVPLPRVNRVAINNHDSHIKNTLDNNENPKRKSKFNSNRLSRANSQRRRTSIIEPDPNRASLIFRRQIMEESLMMSFGGMMMNGVQQQPTSISKPPIRRKTKKGSNAKLEDREVRRERRRKEKLVKKLKESQNVLSNNNNNNLNNNQIEGKDIMNENNVREFHMGPQPPPRKQSHDKPIIPSPQKPKNNALPLLSSPPDRRLGNSNVNSSLEHSTDEPLPFPAHLARSTLFENNSNKERSKRKQQPYSPSKGQPIPSPISSISNNSRVITSNPEGKELTDDDVSQHEVINSEETSSINQLPSPNKSQKIGKNILGLFNKQTTKDSTSPSISQISSPTQLSLQSPPTTPITLSSTTPPQSPPLSPKTLKVPQQLLGKSIQNPEKKKKMEQFEALIANSETSSSKKPISGKIRAITTAITTVASTATSSASSSISMRKKSADGTPYNSPRHSSEGSFKSEGKESEKKNGLKRDSSNRGSLAESVRYRSDEMSELGPGDDGVIRVTLTPEVCR
ncbi:unnamed protein product [Rhizophagus irregularis]|nr:unnamed protein product [Rhizophagus irregularis]